MASIDLFNQTLLFGLYLSAFGLMFYGFSLTLNLKKTHGKRGSKKKQKHEMPFLAWPWIVGGSVVSAGGAWLIIQYAVFPEDTIPLEGIVWVLPIFWSIGLMICGIWILRLVWIGVGGLVLSFLLMAVIANDYYHYYPTLPSVFQHEVAVSTKPTRSTPTKTISPKQTNDVVVEQYYHPLVGQLGIGTLAVLDIPSSTSNFSPRQGRIYLPPALNGNNQIRLPVVILLAGHPGSPINWEQAGLFDIMNEFARQHQGLAPIVAAVDFGGAKDVDTECVDSKLGSAETYLTKDVPLYLKQHFQVQTDASAWAIGGYSAGGTCAPLIALRNPDIYHSFVNISGDAMPSVGSQATTLETLFDGSVQAQLDHTPDVLLKNGNQHYQELSGWYFYGRQDNQAMVGRMKHQYDLARQAGLNVVITGIDGHHGFMVWKEGFVESLPWLSNLMKLTLYANK